MTKREKIIEILKEYGVDLINRPWLEEKKEWQKPGTIVLHRSFVPDLDRAVWLADTEPYKDDPSKRSYTGKCPIELHDIRYHFEWQWGYVRVSLKKS